MGLSRVDSKYTDLVPGPGWAGHQQGLAERTQELQLMNAASPMSAHHQHVLGDQSHPVLGTFHVSAPKLLRKEHATGPAQLWLL